MKKKIIKKIKNIQAKPEDEKTKIVWVLSVFFMILIIGGWFSSFNNEKKSSDNDFNKIILPSFPNIETELSELNSTINKIDSLKAEIINENEQVQIEEIAKLYFEENLSKEDYNNLKIKQIEKQENTWHLEYQQYYKDLLIEENKISLTVDNTDRKVTDFVSNYDKNINVDITPSVEIKKAQDKIISELNNKRFTIIRKGELLFIANSSNKINHKKVVKQLGKVSKKFLKLYSDKLKSFKGEIGAFREFKDIIKDELADKTDKFWEGLL